MIRRKRGAGEHFAIRIRAVFDFIFRRQSLDLFRRITKAFQRAECHEVHRMAGRADFLINLETALKLPLVIGAEWTGKAPAFLLRMVDREMIPARRG